MIGEATINIKELIKVCALTKQPMCFNKKFYEDDFLPNGGMKVSKEEFDKKDDCRFWMDLKYKNSETGEISSRGKVKV